MNFLLLALVVLAVAVTQALAGGRQIILCVPGYGLLALAALLSWWPRRRTPIPRAALEGLVVAVLFCGYVCFRAVFSPEEYLARKDLFVALAALALYLVVALNLTSSRTRLLLVGALLVLALANCAVGAVQFVKGQDFMPFSFLPRPEYGSRASGFYGYPNHLSGFLEMALMLGLGAVFWSRWPTWVKMLSGYACAMCLIGILATGSRGGYISAAVGLMVFILLSLVLVGKLAPGRVIGVAAAGLLLIGGGAWGVKTVMSRSALIQSRADETLTVDVSRMRLWQAAWKQFQLHPAVGTGSGTYLYYGRQFRHAALHTDPVHAHNDYFELLAEYGLIGLVAGVIFLETHMRRGWNAFTSRIGDRSAFREVASNSLALNVGAISAASACLVHSLLDFNLHMPANMLTASLLFALLVTPGEGAEALTEEEPGFPAFLRLALPALGILIAVVVLPTAPAEYDAERARAILSDWHRTGSSDLNAQLEAIARHGLAGDPRNPQLHLALAEALAGQGDLAPDAAVKEAFYDRAIKSYRKTLEYAPGDVGYVLALASALDSVGRFTEADPLFQRALELDPRGGVTHTMMATHWLLQGKLTEAEAEFRQGYQFGAWEAARAGMKHIEEERAEKGNGNPKPN